VGVFARGADRVLRVEDQAALELERHALHAAELSLIHPATGERLHLVAPLPSDLGEFWRGLAVAPLSP
jgi:23S rRNA pseudouridine1911/1915/1917 synthase